MLRSSKSSTTARSFACRLGRNCCAEDSMRIPRLTPLILLSYALFAGCGGEVSGSRVSRDWALACAAWQRAVCDKYETCQDGRATRTYGSMQACVERGTTACELGVNTPGEAPRAPSDLMQCATSFAAQTCDEWFAGAPRDCKPPQAGRWAIGHSCRYGGQCVSLRCEYADGVSVSGHCAPTAKVGDTCVESCGGTSGLSCITDVDGHRRCIQLGDAHATCTDAEPCAFGLFCARIDASAAGECEPPTAQPGEACNDVTGPFCDDRRDSFCDPASNRCGPRKLNPVGEPCGRFTDGTVVACESMTTCVVESVTSSQATCVPDLADGANCVLSATSARVDRPPSASRVPGEAKEPAESRRPRSASKRSPRSPYTSPGAAARITLVDSNYLLPRSASNKNFASCLVVDFSRARKHLLVAKERTKPIGPSARLERAFEWQRQLDTGEVVSRAEIARREGISRARVTQIMNQLQPASRRHRAAR
jgi:hypothetical protein